MGSQFEIEVELEVVTYLESNFASCSSSFLACVSNLNTGFEMPWKKNTSIQRVKPKVGLQNNCLYLTPRDRKNLHSSDERSLSPSRLRATQSEDKRSPLAVRAVSEFERYVDVPRPVALPNITSTSYANKTPASLRRFSSSAASHWSHFVAQPTAVPALAIRTQWYRLVDCKQT